MRDQPQTPCRNCTPLGGPAPMSAEQYRQALDLLDQREGITDSQRATARAWLDQQYQPNPTASPL